MLAYIKSFVVWISIASIANTPLPAIETNFATNSPSDNINTTNSQSVNNTNNLTNNTIDTNTQISHSNDNIPAANDRTLSAQISILPGFSGNLVLNADKIKYSDEQLYASGNVNILGNDYIVYCDTFKYNFLDRESEVENILMKYDHLFLKTHHAKISPSKITTSHTTAIVETTSGNRGPSIHAAAMDIDIEKYKGKAKNVSARIGSIPVLYTPSLPLGMWLKLLRFNATVGHSSDLGAFLRSRIGYSVLPGCKLGTSMGIFLKRGLLFGPFVKLDNKTNTHEIHSLYDFGVISDAHAKKITENDKFIKWQRKTRWYADIQHSQHIGERIDILSSIYWMRDDQFFHDFYDLDEYKHYDIRDQFLEVDYRGDSWIMSVITKPRINSFRKHIQTLPQFHIEKFATEIANSNVFFNGYIDIASYKNPNANEIPTTESEDEEDSKENSKKEATYEEILKQNKLFCSKYKRLDAYVGITHPVIFNNNTSILPKIGYRTVRYTSQQYKNFFQIGCDFASNFYSIYNNQLSFLNISKIKHNVRPIVQYRYIHCKDNTINNSNKNASLRGLYNGESKLATFGMDPIDLESMRDIDSLQSQHKIRIGLENIFYGKKYEHSKSKKLASLYIYQDFNLKRTHTQKFVYSKKDINLNITDKQNEKFLGNLCIHSIISPEAWIDLESILKIDTNKFKLQKALTRWGIFSGDSWKLSILSRYSKDNYKQLGIEWEYCLSEKNSINFKILHDLSRDKCLSAYLSFSTYVGQIWHIEGYLKYKSKSKNKLQPGITVSLLTW